MNDIRDHTPAEWVPFETILCINGAHSQHFLFLGIGPMAPGREDVQLFLALPKHGTARMSWSISSYMKDTYHDIRTCGTILRRP